MWEVDALESLLYYARLPGATPEVAKSIRERLLANLSRASQAFQGSLAQADPYRAPMKDYTWGSNKGKAMQARLYQLAALHGTDPRLSETSLAAALEYAHYIHGVNPLGLVYLTNMAQAGASHSAATMFHGWFARGTRWQRVTEQLPGPPPGFLVGGPNPQFSIDACCSAPARVARHTAATVQRRSRCASGISSRRLEQPPAKSYLQYNDPWPANSWEIYGAFAALPVLLCPVACRLYPLRRHSSCPASESMSRLSQRPSLLTCSIKCSGNGSPRPDKAAFSHLQVIGHVREPVCFAELHMEIQWLGLNFIKRWIVPKVW